MALHFEQQWLEETHSITTTSGKAISFQNSSNACNQRDEATQVDHNCWRTRCDVHSHSSSLANTATATPSQGTIPISLEDSRNFGAAIDFVKMSAFIEAVPQCSSSILLSAVDVSSWSNPRQIL
jgi:hypothetical protein